MKPLVIEEMYAFVADNTDGTGEGVMAFQASREPPMMMAMVGADMDRVNSLYPIAVQIAKIKGVTFKVLRFSKREDITKEVQNGQNSEAGERVSEN